MLFRLGVEDLPESTKSRGSQDSGHAPFRANPRLRIIVREIKNTRGRVGAHHEVRGAPSIMCKIRDILLERRKVNHDNLLLWVTCTTTFFAFCRSGEITVTSKQASWTYPSIAWLTQRLYVFSWGTPKQIRETKGKLNPRSNAEWALPGESHGRLPQVPKANKRPLLSVWIRQAGD